MGLLSMISFHKLQVLINSFVTLQSCLHVLTSLNIISYNKFKTQMQHQFLSEPTYFFINQKFLKHYKHPQKDKVSHLQPSLGTGGTKQGMTTLGFYYWHFSNKCAVNATLASNKPPFDSYDDTIICIEAILFGTNCKICRTNRGWRWKWNYVAMGFCWNLVFMKFGDIREFCWFANNIYCLICISHENRSVKIFSVNETVCVGLYIFIKYSITQIFSLNIFILFSSAAIK